MVQIKDRLRFIGITRYKRIQNYIANLEENIIINSLSDKRIIFEIKELIEDRISRLKKVYLINTILYIGIYFSFISFFFPNFLFFSQISAIVSKIISIVGTTTFFIAIFFTNKLIELYYEDLNLLTSNLISVYTSHLKNNCKIFDSNDYNIFINFFKKRGF